MKKETEKSIKVFRDELTNEAIVHCANGFAYRALAYATAATQLSGEDSQTQHLYEILYWAHWQIGNHFESKSFFNMAIGYEQLKKKYLRDYKHYYQLPKLDIIAITTLVFSGVLDSEYPQEKIEAVNIEEAKGDWLIFLPEDYSLDRYALITAIKMAKDNNKKCITFSDKAVWGIERKLFNNLRKKGVTKIIEAAEGMFQYLHCGPAKVYKK